METEHTAHIWRAGLFFCQILQSLPSLGAWIETREAFNLES